MLYGFSGRDPAKFVKAAGEANLFHIRDLEVPTKQVSISGHDYGTT